MNSRVSGNRAAYFLTLTAVVLGLILPLWSVSVIPWTDYGDHMGRVFVLAHYGDVPAFYHAYEIKRVLLPNLAIDLIGPPLLRFFSPDLVAKLFASFSVLVFAAGCHVFAWEVHRRPTWLVMAAVFYFYNSFLIYGFVNFIWGVALFLITAALWLRFARAPAWLTGAAAMAGAFGTYIAHLTGFVFLCCFLALHLAYSFSRLRRIAGPQLLAAALIPLPALAAYGSLERGERQIGVVLWAFAVKARHAWVLFSGYAAWMDVLVLASLSVALFLVFRYGTVAIEPFYAIVVCAFFLAFLVLPTEFHTGTEADSRFLLPCALIATLAAEVRLPRRAAWVVGALLLIVFPGRIGAIAWYWGQADRLSVEQRALLRTVDEGSRVFPIVFLPGGRTAAKIHQPLIHMAGYATIDRHAISGSAETIPGQQLIRLRTPLPYRGAYTGVALASYPWPAILASYDYVWGYNLPRDFAAFLGRNCEVVAEAGLGRLYRTRPHRR